MRFTGKNAMENKKKIDEMMKELLPDTPSIVTVDEEREDLQETISRLLEKLEVTMEEVRSSKRKPHLVDARCMMAAYLIGLPSVRQVDIAAILAVSQVAVSKMLKRHDVSVKFHPPYRRKWEAINQ